MNVRYYQEAIREEVFKRNNKISSFDFIIEKIKFENLLFKNTLIDILPNRSE